MTSSTLPRPHPAVLFRPVTDGAVLLLSTEEVYFGLDAVGSRIWSLLPPESSDLDQLVDRLAVAYPDVEPETLRTDVVELLGELREAGLVVDPS